MCRMGRYKIVLIQQGSPSCSTANWDGVLVDACIADFVQTLNNQGIKTLGSCCGHGIFQGDILIEPGHEDALTAHGYDFYIDEDGDTRIEFPPLEGWFWTLYFWWRWVKGLGTIYIGAS
jgi:hypothetical protein